MRADSVLAGILLPDTVFAQEWMWYLGAFVALNRVVCGGRSSARCGPGPRPPSKTTLDEWRHRTSRNRGADETADD